MYLLHFLLVKWEYRIRFNAALGFYFSIWVFEWGSIKKKNTSNSGLFDQKVGFFSRKTPKTGLFTLPGVLFKSGAALKWILHFPTLGNVGK